MTIKRRVLAEYINQIREDLPGTCIHKKAETIIRGHDCKYLKVPRLDNEPIMCSFHKRETTPNCFCCWAKRRPYPKEFWRGDKFLKFDR